METWSLPKARPISCNDCPTFQRLHMSVRWFAESFTRLRNGINTTFREKIYTRWCCIDRLSWLVLSGPNPPRAVGFCSACNQVCWSRRYEPFWNSHNLISAEERYRKKNGTRGMGLIYWIVVGLVAGWLAGKVMKGSGYGVLVDIVLGIFGGIVGGWVFGMLGIWPGGGMIGSIIVAFIGAVILLWITRLLKKA